MYQGGPPLAVTIRKELAVSLLTICGVLSTVAVSYAVRRVPVFRHAAVAGEAHFVFFVVYGLAISLVAAASTVIRRRDTVIVILAATIAWVVFVEARQLLGMLRFLVFASLATAGVLAGGRAAPGSKPWHRIARGAALPGGLCCAAGLAYYGLVAYFGHAQAAAARELLVGGVWGLSLGLAVGLGLALGREALRWMSRDD
jgi:hypothetical protein